ncbi:MAG: 2OG-Fe(II) oxygenase [Pseudobdellovibrionaceae bacterium]
MTQNQINLLALRKMFDELAEKKFSSSQNIFSESFCRALANECHSLHNAGAFQKASIGHGVNKSQHAEIRGDSTLWIDEGSSSLQKELVTQLHLLMQHLNETFYVGLKRFETHFAVYAPGAGYDKHVDNHKGSGARRMTFILYLNENWQPGHGGELSFYSPDNEENLITQIEPKLGTFVLFRSELFPHQVEKSIQPRLSVTGWFRNDTI